MSEKFQNKYRIPSARLQNWDYGSNALYFVTICTQARKYYFGEITNRKMELSEIGKIARQCWHDIPIHFPFVELGEFVVMPNHVHGIIIINKPDETARMVKNGDVPGDASGNVPVETQNFASLQLSVPSAPPSTTQSTGNKFGPQSKNLASIVRGFKIGVTKFARTNNIVFDWQPRFHDHIIRNDESFQRISDYITNNPANWRDDKFFNNIR